MSYQLSIRLGDGSVQQIDLGGVAMPCIAGRDSDEAQIVVHDPQVSRAHCRFEVVATGLAIEDLASRNGIFLNHQRVARCVLKPGDVLRLGGSELRLSQVEDEPADPLVGSRLGGFEIKEVLGRGRYGTAYRAVQLALGREVAVKVLAEASRGDSERVQSFLTEARRAGRLNHPNLVQVHDVCQVGEQYLLVMELMSHSVGEMIEEDGQLEAPVVLKILRDVSRALSYAESQRLVHRDVKPDNILVNDEGTFKLADLGIATPISDDGQAHQDRIFGSPHYVAPEQAKGGAIDGRADLYALGASAWHMLTGKPIFTGSTRQIVAAHINSPLPDLRRLRPSLPSPLVDLVYRLLEKDPGRRPADADELGKQVERLLNSSAVMPLRRVRRRRRRFR